MRKLLCAFMTAIFMMACAVKITTPENDARILNEKYNKCTTPKEIDRVVQDLSEYVNLYKAAVYDGRMSMDDFERFAHSLCFNVLQAENDKACMMESGEMLRREPVREEKGGSRKENERSSYNYQESSNHYGNQQEDIDRPKYNGPQFSYSEVAVYKGMINGKYPITMTLREGATVGTGSMTNTEYTGTYYYDKQGSDKTLRLEGMIISGESTLYMEEFNENGNNLVGRLIRLAFIS